MAETSQLEKLVYISKHPQEMLQKYLSEGKKVVGCMPIYTPEELVYAAGMVPMGIWGAEKLPSSYTHFPSFACSIMHSILELASSGKYEGLSAAMLPVLCDTFRGAVGEWKYSVPNIPLIALTQAQNRTHPAALDYMVDEYRYTAERLEKISGTKITAVALYETFAIYNAHKAIMMKFAETANKHLDVITPAVRHAVMKSAMFVDKAEHTAMMKSLIDELDAMPEFNFKGKRVVITGITCEPDEILDIIQENGFAVVGDDLAQETRQYRTMIPDGYDQFTRLGQQWMNITGDAVVHEEKSMRCSNVIDLAKKTDADAIIWCIMKFCDPEQYQVPYMLRAVENEGIPLLRIEIDQNSSTIEQCRTRIQSFAEMM